MRIFHFTAVLVVLHLSLVPEAYSRSLGNPSNALKRWRRTAGLGWTCSKVIDGCLVQISCSSNFPLMLDTLRCRLGSRDYNCRDGIGDSLNFTLNARSEGVADGRQHSLSLSVRAAYGSGFITFPWVVQFTVDADCSSVTEPPTTERTPATSPPTVAVPQVEEVSCSYVFEGRVIVITCSSSSHTVTRISYFINGVPIGARVGNEVRLSSSQLRPGSNTIDLDVRTSSGSSSSISLQVDTSQPTATPPSSPTTVATTRPPPTTVTTPRPPPTTTMATTRPTTPPTVAPPVNRQCRYECRGTLNSRELRITCDVDSSANGILSIQYAINGGNTQNADSIPTFSIATSSFRNGGNRVDVTVSHSECGSGVMELSFQYQRPSPSSLLQQCTYECNARLSSTELTVTCTVNGREDSRSSISYQVNGGARVNANSAPTFTILITALREGANEVAITISHPDCSQSGNLQLRFTYQRPQSPVPMPTPALPGVSCRVGQQGSNVVFTCSSSSLAITRISYFVNGAPVGVSASGVVQIAESHFRNGANDVRLVVSKTDGSSEEVSMTVNIERDPPPIQPSPLPGHTTPAPLRTCRYECRARQQGRELSVTCTVNGQEDSRSSISYQANGGASVNASSAPTFSISTSHFRSGENVVDVSISHPDCSQPGSLQFVFPFQGITPSPLPITSPPTITYPTPTTSPPIVCELNCTYQFGGGVFAFQCELPSLLGTLLTINHSLNGQMPQESVGGSFTIPQSDFMNGNNTLHTSVLIICGGEIRTLERYLIITLQLPPTVSSALPAFRVQITGTSPANYATLVPGFPVSATYTVDEEGEYLVIRVSGTGSQRVIVLGYSINGASTSYLVGDTVRVHKDSLREGENSVVLTVFGSLAGRLVMTSTLNVTKVGSTPPPPPPPPPPVCQAVCNATYDGNTVRVVCYDSSNIDSITYSINQRTTHTVQSSEFVIHGGLLTRNQNSVEITVNCQHGGAVVIPLQLVQPLNLTCQSVAEEEGVRVRCASNRQASSLSRRCYIDSTPLPNCTLSNILSYSRLSPGQHTFKIEVTDDNDLTATSQLSFLFKFEICCQGTYNSINDVIHVSCDSNRPIAASQFRINSGPLTTRLLPFNVDVSSYVGSGTVQLHIEAQDRYGSRDSSDLSFAC